MPLLRSLTAYSLEKIKKRIACVAFFKWQMDETLSEYTLLVLMIILHRRSVACNNAKYQNGRLHKIQLSVEQIKRKWMQLTMDKCCINNESTHLK